MKKTPTILFESGHFPGDYDRDKTRELICKSILKGIEVIAKDLVSNFPIEHYLSIPENGKQFVDILVINPNNIKSNMTNTQSVPIQYKEVLQKNKIVFEPHLHYFDKEPKVIFAHKTLNCNDENDVTWLKDNNLMHLLS